MIPILRKTTGRTVLAIALGTATLAGCTKDKKEENQAEKFAGTWKGSGSCNGSSASNGELVFTATDNKTVTTNYSVGDGSCVQGKTLTGTADGNTVNFPTTTLTDGCGLSYSVSAYGKLENGTFTFTLSVNGAITGTCTFTGTK